MNHLITRFAPSKVILTGEHAVVHGYSAVVAALAQGVRVHVRQLESGSAQKLHPYLAYSKSVFLDFLGQPKDILVEVEIESDLPMRSGMGTSASIASAFLQALAEIVGVTLTKRELFTLTHQAEHFVHSQSSGLDPAAVVFGGLVKFNTAQEPELLPEVLIQKQSFFLLSSGVPQESTGELVNFVSEQMQQSDLVRQTLAKIGAIAEKFAQLLAQGRFVPQLLQDNQRLLEELGVVGETAKSLIHSIEQLGGLAKITGAGGRATGSGFILAWHEDAQILQDFIIKKELLGFPVNLI